MQPSDRKNRGEWSELYALLHLLSTGAIRVTTSGSDSANSVWPVVFISRKIDGVPHDFRIGEFDIEVLPNSEHAVGTKVSRQLLISQRELLLAEIKKGKGRAFSISDSKQIMDSLGLNKATGTTEKSDLIITIYDPRINRESEQGFSIKSFIGGRPTLLNASGVTSIEYAIQGRLTSEKIQELNKLGLKEMVITLQKMGHSLIPTRVDSRFAENLKMIDNQMDQLVAQIVIASLQGQGRSMHDIVNRLEISNPLNYSTKNCRVRYIHKIKDLLEAVSLGMRPSEPWEGESEAKGGNLIVTSNGGLLCHHSFDKDSLRNYLFDHTYIDTPSRKRYKFGKIADGLLSLNFQIRMS